MDEHRPVLDPSILARLQASIEPIQRAWASDVARLRIAEDRLAFTDRELQLEKERVGSLRADIAQIRADNHGLLKRNAHLEAQLGRVFDNSVDAEGALRALRERAVEAVRTAPTTSDVMLRKPWRYPEKNPPGEDDGTALPPGAPLIFQRPGSSADRLPTNEFSQRAASGSDA